MNIFKRKPKMEMNKKIQNLYDEMECLADMKDKMFRIIVILSETEGFKTEVSCDKYAKFLINDFSGLKNKLGDGLYGSFDSLKLKALFSISEQFGCFTRKEVIDFLEYRYDGSIL